ncbi:MAG: glycosyltransferase family 9 protein [Saprospiraceae bacterium]
MGSNPKILIVRFSSIGDIVLTTPVVRCLKEQLGAEVHYLTKERFRPVLEANPHIDVLHTIKKSVAEAVPALKALRFDYLADLHGNLRTLQLKLALGIPGAGFSKLNLEKWLLVRTKADYLPRLHIVDRYMAAAHELGVRYDGQGLDYFLPPGADVDVRALFEKKGYTGPWDGRFAAFAIGAAHATKRLPAGQIAEVCRRLTGPVLLLGGPEDREAGEEVARQAGPHTVNACGDLGLNQSASAVSRSALVISHDTGLMHIAAAFRKPIVSVWGNTVPAFGMTPFYPDGIDLNITLEQAGLSCRPCSKIGYIRCPKGHFRCMEDHDPQVIAAAASYWMEGGAAVVKK